MTILDTSKFDLFFFGENLSLLSFTFTRFGLNSISLSISIGRFVITGESFSSSESSELKIRAVFGFVSIFRGLVTFIAILGVSMLPVFPAKTAASKPDSSLQGDSTRDGDSNLIDFDKLETDSSLLRFFGGMLGVANCCLFQG